MIHRTRDLRPGDVTTHWGIPTTTPPISNGFVCGYEVDLHWPQLKLVAELDGYGFHGHRRAFETDQLTELRVETASRFTALLSQRS